MTALFAKAKDGAAPAAPVDLNQPSAFLERHRIRFDRCLRSERLGFLGQCRVLLDIEDELRERGADDKPQRILRSWYAPDEMTDFDVSVRWQVAHHLMRYLGEAVLIAARSRDYRVWYAMARRASRLVEFDHYASDKAAQIAWDELRELTRDQAEARINPRPDGPAASMTRTTPTGRYEKPVVQQYELGFQRDANAAKESPTQALETWGDVWANCPESFTSSVRRWRDSGIRQDWAAETEFACVYLSEIGVSPVITKVMRTWLELPRGERKPAEFAQLILSEIGELDRVLNEEDA